MLDRVQRSLSVAASRLETPPGVVVAIGDATDTLDLLVADGQSPLLFRFKYVERVDSLYGIAYLHGEITTLEGALAFMRLSQGFGPVRFGLHQEQPVLRADWVRAFEEVELIAFASSLVDGLLLLRQRVPLVTTLPELCPATVPVALDEQPVALRAPSLSDVRSAIAEAGFAGEATEKAHWVEVPVGTSTTTATVTVSRDCTTIFFVGDEAPAESSAILHALTLNTMTNGTKLFCLDGKVCIGIEVPTVWCLPNVAKLLNGLPAATVGAMRKVPFLFSELVSS